MQSSFPKRIEKNAKNSVLQNILPLAAALFFVLPAHAADRIRTLDGDTFNIGKERVRIATIDAPETKQAKCDAERRLGMVAKRRLDDLLRSGTIDITRGDPKDGRKKDRHGRTLATATVDGKDVGEMMIAEGLARPWAGRRMPWCR